ncbi:hypothetical protein FS749_002308 [Ceratobasidium sp. UAMH 11750]|nr:hypothetical protein FS749_002308 [Ceratobasidium sp. UAMH 11750]
MNPCDVSLFFAFGSKVTTACTSVHARVQPLLSLHLPPAESDVGTGNEHSPPDQVQTKPDRIGAAGQKTAGNDQVQSLKHPASTSRCRNAPNVSEKSPEKSSAG